MSGHKKTFYQTLDQAEEKAIFWIVIGLLIAVFIWQVLAIGSDLGLFRYTFFSARFWTVLWESILTAWQYRIGPIFIFVEIILAIIFLIALVNFWKIKSTVKIAYTRPPVRTRKVRFKKDPTIATHWGAIINRVKVGTQDAMRYAILEADSLVDHFLKKAGFSGEHMADRLGQIVADRVPSIERVWKAHKLRNELAHTPGLTVTAAETKEALEAFRDFLVELGAL